MSSNFETLYGEEVYADLIIECENRRFKVHKVVICIASPVIARMLDPRNSMKESTSNVIKHEQFDAASLQRMIEFAYRGVYTVDEDRPQGASPGPYSTGDVPATITAAARLTETPPRDIKDMSATRLRRLIAHAHAYAIADYYGVSGMMAEAEDLFCSNMPYGWDASEVDRLLELIVAIARVTVEGDEDGVRNETVDFAAHMLRQLKDNAAFFSAVVDSEYPAVRALAAEIFARAASQLQSRHHDNVFWSGRDKRTRREIIDLRRELKSNAVQHESDMHDLRARKTKEAADATAALSAVLTKQIAEVARAKAEGDERTHKEANRWRQLAEKLSATRKNLDKLSSFIEDLPETCSNRKCSSTPLTFVVQRKGKYGCGGVEVRCRDCRARLKVEPEKARNVLMPATEEKTDHGEFAVYLLPNRST
nr:hypothetical protein B0A51_01634 [Rachicladosporium sp. CCFEE 5018]OQO31538.1 hypothetical protein B0A51_01305 [Rachicladosporium sp. CCFEE 5018]